MLDMGYYVLRRLRRAGVWWETEKGEGKRERKRGKVASGDTHTFFDTVELKEEVKSVYSTVICA
jgi:hypothetical protein